ncbi:radical SAM protein [Verrucomicrobiota bacterium sgz303538]
MKEATPNTCLSSVPSTKVRFGPDGIHLFARGSGANLLIGEIVPPKSMWAAAPRQVSIALTNTCDLSCSYCFAPKTHVSLAFDRVISWLDELDANGTIGVGFGGGEPTLYRQFAELCAHTSRNTGLAVTFTTHGHHLNEALLAQLKGNVHFCRVSMDGIGSTYERLRRRSFDVLARRLTGLKQIVPFGINYVVNSCTLPDIGLAAEFAEAAGASEFLLLPEQPVQGRGGINDSTAEMLRRWVESYSGGMRLAVSEKGADGMPTSDPFENETGLRAYVHIDANGVLRPTSYDLQGTPIGSRGVLAALAELHNHSHTTA